VLTDALLLDRSLSLRNGPRDVPEPQPGEVVVRVEWAGVSARDLHVLRTGDRVAHWPATLGHEVAGTVENCPGGELPAGRRVVIDSRVPCENCAGCAAKPVRCERLARVGEARPGGFAGHLLMAAGRVVACPDSLEAAVAVLAEPLAVAIHALGRVPGPPERAAILGYGPVGALVHLEISRQWPETETAVVEPVASRRELARALGAGVTSREELEARNAGRRPRLVVDAAGYPGALADALALCEDGGTVLALAPERGGLGPPGSGVSPGGAVSPRAGTGREPAKIVPDLLAGRGLMVAGSTGFSGELADAVAALSSDPERYRPVVTESVLLDEAPSRLRELLESPSAGKVLIRP
jgi:threonine dehydrogenase-like Zn-dependent dehydrogenase